jgi:hypothetical protein
VICLSHQNDEIEEMEKFVASYSLIAVLLVTLFIAVWKQQWIWVIGCVAGVSIGFVPALLHRNIKITLPWQIELLIAAVCALNMGGVLLRAYYTIPGYNQITQFLTSILFAFLAFAIIYILDEYWDGLKMDKYAMAFVVVIGTMASCVILEFVKWIQLFGAKQQSVEEVLTSLLIGTIGGIIMAFIGVTLIKKGEFDELTEDLGKQFDSVLKQRSKKKTK